MATIRIWSEEYHRLPNRCVVCGTATTRQQEVLFTQTPSAWWLFLIASLLPFGLLVLVYHNSVTLKLPVCEDDADDWFWKRTVPLRLCFAPMFVTAMASIFAEKDSPGSGAYYFCFGAIVTVFAIGYAIIAMGRRIRATRIDDDDSATLINVSDVFAEAIWAARDPGDRETLVGRTALHGDRPLPPEETEEIDPRL